MNNDKQCRYALENRTLVKYHPDETREEWGTIDEFDELFDTCVERWGNNWDFNKVLIAIKESEID